MLTVCVVSTKRWHKKHLAPQIKPSTIRMELLDHLTVAVSVLSICLFLINGHYTAQDNRQQRLPFAPLDRTCITPDSQHLTVCRSCLRQSCTTNGLCRFETSTESFRKRAGRMVERCPSGKPK